LSGLGIVTLLPHMISMFSTEVHKCLIQAQMFAFRSNSCQIYQFIRETLSFLAFHPCMNNLSEKEGSEHEVVTSKIICIGNAKDSLESYLFLFGCKQDDFPIKYLGLPIHFKKMILFIGT
ncbi:hypothetical protein ACJX0J_008845, partial [Zea mays]